MAATDPTGHFALAAVGASALAGAFLGGGASLAWQLATPGCTGIDWGDVGIAAAFGAANGALAPLGSGLTWLAFVGAGANVGQYYATERYHDRDTTADGFRNAAVLGGLGAWAGGTLAPRLGLRFRESALFGDRAMAQALNRSQDLARVGGSLGGRSVAGAAIAAGPTSPPP